MKKDFCSLYNASSMRIITVIFLARIACTTLSAQTEFPKPDGLAPANGYSHVVTAKPGKLVFIAGQVANDKQGQLVGKDDLKAQTVQVFEISKPLGQPQGPRLMMWSKLHG